MSETGLTEVDRAKIKGCVHWDMNVSGGVKSRSERDWIAQAALDDIQRIAAAREQARPLPEGEAIERAKKAAQEIGTELYRYIPDAEYGKWNDLTNELGEALDALAAAPSRPTPIPAGLEEAVERVELKVSWRERAAEGDALHRSRGSGKSADDLLAEALEYATVSDLSCVDLRLILTALNRTAGEWRPDPEAMARIIDPIAYQDFPVGGPEPDYDWHDRNVALAKAASILALQPQPAGEAK